MTKETKLELTAIAVILVSFLTLLIIQGYQNENLKKQAIQHGFAQYNPVTGDWEWITNKTATLDFSIKLR